MKHQHNYKLGKHGSVYVCACGRFRHVNTDNAIIAVTPHDRLEYLRGEIRAERISYGELLELQSLAQYIQPGDVELLEPAGVKE